LNAVLAAFAAFLAAAVRPQTPLAKAIMAVLLVKLIALTGIGVFMLASRAPAPVGSAGMERLFGPTVSVHRKEGL
jgi:hypothetical protein